jgi:MOSC domain-containing protein YiiM
MGICIQSIQVAMPSEMETSEGVLRTAMLKQPVQGPVELGQRALAGDGCAHTKYHGHEDQAVCVYPAQHLADLAVELDLPKLGPGSFGDNFTVVGGDESSVRVGEVYRIGTALVEVTKPREPCHLLNEVSFCNQVAASLGRTARTGWYLRVLEPGVVEAGDPWRLERPAAPGAPTIAKAWRAKPKA